MRLRATVLVVVSAVAVASCGGSDGGATKAKYGDFCLLAWDLDAQSKGTHGEDPTAMSDPAKMKTAWGTITASAAKLRDAAPSAVNDAVTTLVDSIEKMDAVYAKYDYNLMEMAQVPAVAEELGAISNGTAVTEASAEFKAFMQKNCGESS